MMKYYLQDKRFVIVGNPNSRYFERTFRFDKVFDVTIPQGLSHPKTKKPYGSISKKETLDFIKQIIREYEHQVERHNDLIKKIKRCE